MFNWREWSGRNAELAQARREKQRQINKQNGRSSPKRVAQAIRQGEK